MPDHLMMPPLTFCTQKVTLAAGTTTTISNTGTTHYCIKGLAYSKTAMTNAATPTTDAAKGTAFAPISANQGSVFVVGFDAAQAVKVAQGSIESLDAAGKFINSPQFGTLPDNVCPVGYITVKGGATLVGTWTFGTNNNSGVTGMTYTFVDVMTMPPRPTAV